MSRLFGPKPKEPEKPAAAAPPPSGLSRDEAKAIVSEALSGVAGQLQQTVTALSERVTALAERQPQVVVQPAAAAPAAPVNRGISDEELDQAFLSGQGAAQRVRALVDRAVNEATQRVIDQHVKPLQEFGVNAMANLSQDVAMGRMPYYPKYKKEIDQRLAALDPAIRTNTAALKMVHDAVVGEHAQDLIREAGEEAVRKAQEEATKGATQPGTGAGRPEREAPEVPTAERLAGDEGMSALSHKGSGGQSQDDFARGLGYKDWADYMKQYDELVKAETQGNA